MQLEVIRHPAGKFSKGDVFTPVCHSVHGGVGDGVSGRPPRQTPPTGRQPPPTSADGTHPTGMHSCAFSEEIRKV